MKNELINKTYILSSEQETETFATRIAKLLHPPLMIGFMGPLGVGKTTFIRAMLRSLGVKGAIKSPTYAILETYPCASFVVYHFDLYRMESSEELELIGFRDCLSSNAVGCIEWPENTRLSFQTLDVLFRFQVQSQERSLQMSACSALGEQWLHSIE